MSAVEKPAVSYAPVEPEPRGPVGLYLTAFFGSVANGVLVVAQSARVFDLEGTPHDVGFLGSLAQALYLFGCLALAPFGASLGMHRVVRAGLALLTLNAVGLTFVGGLDAFTLLAGTQGLWACLLWPMLMGWVSTGVEGSNLIRRLGVYNMSWSSGMVLGPVVGGEVYHHFGSTSAFGLVVVCFGLGCLFALLTAPPETSLPKAVDEASGATFESTDKVRFFSLAGRLANLFGYVAVGLFRYQLPSLLKHLDLDTNVAGRLQMVFSFAIALGFVILARTGFWHYRFSVLVITQLVLLAVVASLWGAVDSATIMIAAGVGGLCTALTYSASAFYGAAANPTRRSRAMAIHEVVQSIGFVAGSYGGGWVSHHSDEIVAGSDIHLTYPIAAGVLAFGVVLQLGLLVWYRLAQSPARNPSVRDASAEA